MAASTIELSSLRVADTDGARRIVVEDSSTPIVKHMGWAYKASGPESMDLDGICQEGFDTTRAIEVVIAWLAASDTNTAHTVEWKTYLLKIVKDASHTDLAALDVSTDYTVDTVVSTLSASGKKMTTATITIAAADHDCDEGDTFHLRIERNTAGTDNVTGDAYLMEGHLIVREAS